MSSRSRTIQVRIDYSGLSDLRRVGAVRESVEQILEGLVRDLGREVSALIARSPDLRGIAVSAIFDLGP